MSTEFNNSIELFNSVTSKSVTKTLRFKNFTQAIPIINLLRVYFYCIKLFLSTAI